MNFVDLSTIKKVHFIGIGGIGVSALARMMLQEGRVVSGSDNAVSELILELKKEGAYVVQGHDRKHISKDIDLVVYTAAISKDNVELHEARVNNIPTLSYGETLGLVSRDKKVIAISGTHGKTTTTAMIAEILMKAGIDPMVVVGSLLSHPKTNFIKGKGEWFITEADEYKKSFLNLNPFILVITNIDEDHLDFYKNLEAIQDAFIELVKKIPPQGALICNAQHPHLIRVVREARCRVVDYTHVDIQNIHLKVPGSHNRENAQAGYAVADSMNISQSVIVKSLQDFRGAWRRFEYKGMTKIGALVYDDYAHNPHKVRAVISGAREMFPEKRIVIVFQPHLYSRTKLLLSAFVDALSTAHEIILTPIYAAREAFDASISSDVLASLIKKKNTHVSVVSGLDDLKKRLRTDLDKNDVCLLVGAGDIYTVALDIVS